MKKIFLIPLIILLVMGFVMGGCAEPAPTTPAPTTPAPTTPAPQVFNLTMGTFHPAQDPINSVIHQSWFNWLEKQSGGRLKFTLMAGSFPQGQLYDAARTNVIDIADTNLGQYADRFPLLEVLFLPMVFDFPGTRSVCMTGTALYDKYPELQAEHTDVKLITLHGSGPNHPATISKPVRTLEDWKGLLQIELGTWGAKAAKAFGATPVEMDPAEYPDAMAKGVVDGITSNYQGTMLFGHIQYVKYVTEASLYLDPFIMVMNMDTWNSLPADLQQLFIESHSILPELYGYDFDKNDMMAKEACQAALQEKGSDIYFLPDEEKARWEDAIQPVREEWIAKAAAKVGEAKARAILDDAIKFADQYRYETTPFETSQQTLHDWGAPGY